MFKVINGIFATCLAITIGLSALPCRAEVVRQDFIKLGNEDKRPIYEWRDPSLSTKGVIVTIHGVSLHGGVFDALARYLASEGFTVLSPDLVGHGRRHYEKDVADFDPIADYEKAEIDLAETLKEIRSEFTGKKVFWLGESLGSNYAVRIAAKHPELVDGLILSAPTIRRHHGAPAKLMSDMCVNTLIAPNKQLSLKNYASKYLADDPKIINDYLADPLMRKSLSPRELLSGRKVIKSTLPYAEEIKNNMPVLVIQGTLDRMVQAIAAEDLMSRMKSNDRTLHWAENRGHLLFMTAHVQPDLEVVVDRWLNTHLETPQVYTTASDLPNETSAHGSIAN